MLRVCCGRRSPPRLPSFQHAPNLTPCLPRKIHGLEGVPGTRDFPPLAPLAPRSPRPGTRGLRMSDPPLQGGAGTGLAAAVAGRAAESPPPGAGGGGATRGGRGDDGGGEARGSLPPGRDPGLLRCWGGGTRLTLGRGARAGRAAGSAAERAGLRRRPHPRMGPRVGDGRPGPDTPRGWAPLSRLRIPSAGEVLGADGREGGGAPPQQGALRVRGSAREPQDEVHFC